MTSRILFVANDPGHLEAYRRDLGEHFQVTTAAGADEGLATIRGHGPFAVLVSDADIPLMDSVRLLAQVREIAPLTVRMMLAEAFDTELATAMVNEAKVQYFLAKPCELSVLTSALEQGVALFRAATAEHELAQQILSALTDALADLLGLANPVAFHRALDVRGCVNRLSSRLGAKKARQFEAAAMLSQLGCVAFSPEVLEFVVAGHPVSDADRAAFSAHPMVARTLLSKIPRMGAVALIVAQQHTPLAQLPEVVDGMTRDDIALGGDILRLAIAYEDLLARGSTHGEAINALRSGPLRFGANLLDTLASLHFAAPSTDTRSCSVRELMLGMIIHEDIRTTGGLLLVAKGQELTYPLIEHLRTHRECHTIKEPILVTVRSK